MEKNLSIFINFFKEISVDSIRGKYNIINYNDNISLNTKMFFNNISNKNYFLLFVLMNSSYEVEILGEYLIYSDSELKKRFNNKNSREVGVFEGTFGETSFNIIKNIFPGKYELCCLGKEIEDFELEELRKKVKNRKNLNEFKNEFKIYASCPFDVVKN